MRDHGVFYPHALSDELSFEITLAPTNMVVKGSDPTNLGYVLTNIQLQYEVLHDRGLAKEPGSTYLNGKQFFYEHVTHHKMITVKKEGDPIINESINVPHHSMKGLLLLLSEPHAGGARDSKKFFNPGIKSVKVNVNGVPNKVYSQGMKGLDLWGEVYRHFRKNDESIMQIDTTDFYTGDMFGLFIDLRSMGDNTLHGSGLRLMNTKDSVQLEIERNPSGSGSVKCYIFLISDAQLSILNYELDSVQY